MIPKIITSPKPIHIGASTHHQLHVITPQSFSTINTICKTPPKLMPLLARLFSMIINSFLIFIILFCPSEHLYYIILFSICQELFQKQLKWFFWSFCNITFYPFLMVYITCLIILATLVINGKIIS